MSKFLLILLLASSAQAAVYRDRYIPNGPPCMISVNGAFVNATLVKSVEVNDFYYTRYESFFNPMVTYTRRSMRITLISGEHYDTFDGDLFAAAADALKKIQACSK